MLLRHTLMPVSAAVLALGSWSCAHAPARPATPEPARALQAEASRVREVRFEDEFNEARWIYQALPAAAQERTVLRTRLLHYLLDPVVRLDVSQLRKEVGELGADDVYERVFDSVRDAVELFDPADLWASPPRVASEDRDLLAKGARVMVELFSPRGSELEVALGLSILGTVGDRPQESLQSLDALVRWVDEVAGQSIEGLGSKQPTTGVELLNNVAASFPSPSVSERLEKLYAARQGRFVGLMRSPGNREGGRESARRALGDLLLLHGQDIQRAVVNVVALYLRSGSIQRAAQAAVPYADQAGDDADLRALVTAAARPGAPVSDYLALARRFLPRFEMLGGTSPNGETPDLTAASRVLDAGLRAYPSDPEQLLLAAHLARIVGSPFLAIRRLEEARAAFEKSGGPQEKLSQISAELLELYFLKLRLALDPERTQPAPPDTEALRRQFADARRRFPEASFKVEPAEIDVELARSYVNAGVIDRAEPLFMRAQTERRSSAEVTLELARLSLKRGDTSRAVKVLQDGLEALRAHAPAHDTVESVEGRSRLQALLGDVHDVSGDPRRAVTSWRAAVEGWERLMIDHLRRKNLASSAEATWEVGRLLYQLGRRDEGLQKLDEAIEQDPERDQSYIDSVAFLVQNGESDAAVSIYRRALSRPNRAVSEYVKVYCSLWVLDITRRAHGTPDHSAERYLRTLDARHGEIRPVRGGVWYRQLARHATGRLSYESLLQAADTLGKRAEVYFYESMRRLSDGKAEDAHGLWQKVVDTKMFSFFEFDMAFRYLRLGAASAPRPERRTATETI